MKPKNIDPAKARQKRDAVKSVAVSGAFRLIAAAVLLHTREGAPWPWLHEALLWLSVLALLTIPFSLVVLRQRFKEIDKGELEDAKRY